ncbi:MAG TPA: type II toxin-antitoxin system prevent-host-death family antitoxin [Methylocystis sp.]|nr:type II toxin-antitoxin system prevent-host-death family antitoxin [Methylocystis sp.]
MTDYPIAEAREQLSKLIDAAAAGEVVTITRDGVRVAELRAAGPADVKRSPTAADIEWLRARRAELPPLEDDAVSIVRAMRDV